MLKIQYKNLRSIVTQVQNVFYYVINMFYNLITI